MGRDIDKISEALHEIQCKISWVEGYTKAKDEHLFKELDRIERMLQHLISLHKTEKEK